MFWEEISVIRLILLRLSRMPPLVATTPPEGAVSPPRMVRGKWCLWAKLTILAICVVVCGWRRRDGEEQMPEVFREKGDRV
jgi:hypothetical protein